MERFLPPSEYPKAMIPVIEAFKQQHADYGTVEEAEGQCMMASCDFQECVEEAGLLDDSEREKGWDVVRVTSIGADRYDVAALVNQHWVFRWGAYAIDCTARQFIENAPFPAVWKLVDGEWSSL